LIGTTIISRRARRSNAGCALMRRGATKWRRCAGPQRRPPNEFGVQLRRQQGVETRYHAIRGSGSSGKRVRSTRPRENPSRSGRQISGEDSLRLLQRRVRRRTEPGAIVHGVQRRERAPEGGSIETGGVTREVETAPPSARRTQRSGTTGCQAKAERARRTGWKSFDRSDDEVSEGMTIDRRPDVNETARDQLAEVRRTATSSAYT
jgi:hypothetical protein